MHQSEAKTFVEKLFADIWMNGNVANLDQYYANNIKGYFNSTPITYDDIKNRVEFISKCQKNRRAQFEDIIATDNKIAARFTYHFVDLNDNQEKIVKQMVFYQLTNNKIDGIWIVCEEPANYKEKP